MNVFRILPDYNYRGLSFRSDKEGEMFIESFDRSFFVGETMVDKWVPPIMIPYEDSLESADFSSFGGGGISLSPQAYAQYSETLKHFGEFLPFTLEGQEWYAYNVTNVIDALDEERSEMHIQPSGLVVGVKKFAFKRQCFNKSIIFKLRWNRNMLFIATDLPSIEGDFYHMYQEQKSTGLSFRPVYSE